MHPRKLLRFLPAIVLAVCSPFIATVLLALLTDGGKEDAVLRARDALVPIRPQLIASTISGEAVSASGQLFWIDSRNGGHSVYGYDLGTQKEFLVSDGYNGALRSTGKQLTWLTTPDSNHKMKVQRYDPDSKEQRTIGSLQLSAFMADPFEGFPMFAADADMVYSVHQDAAGTLGLYALDFTSGNERLVTDTPLSDCPPGPVAGDGVLLWPEVSYPGTGKYRIPHIKLHVEQIGGTHYPRGRRLLPTWVCSVREQGGMVYRLWYK